MWNLKLRTPNSELRTLWERDPKLTTLPLTLDEVLSQVQTGLPGKVLFGGERAGEISSYVAGWLAGRGIDVIVLDGANRFDPYMVSSFARKALISSGETSQKDSNRKGLHLLSDGNADGGEIGLTAQGRRNGCSTAKAVGDPPGTDHYLF